MNEKTNESVTQWNRNDEDSRIRGMRMTRGLRGMTAFFLDPKSLAIPRKYFLFFSLLFVLNEIERVIL